MDFNRLNNMSEKKQIAANIAAMILLIVLILTGGYLSLTFYTHHGNTVVVPNVIGKDYEEAKDLLKQAGLRVTVRDTGYVTSLPADLILDQQIPAGTTVKYNRPVLLTINAGHAQTKPLPEIIDGSARSAEIMLKSMGFTIGRRKTVPGDDDLVMAVEVYNRPVHTGDRISVEAPIVLVVGDGKVTEVFNGNDSLDWALEQEMRETEAKKERAKEALKEKLRAEREAENASTPDANHTDHGVSSVHTAEPIEKIAPPKKSADLFKK